MVTYIIRRLLLAIPVVVIVGVLVFFLIHLTPGDPAAIILGPEATESTRENLRQEMGLNEPLVVQFFDWFGGALTGDLGTSIYSGQAVVSELLDHAGPTLGLAGLGLVMGLMIAIATAMLAVWKRGTFLDPMFMSISILGVSIPNFWFALVLILVVGVTFPIFPVSGYVPPSEGLWQWLYHLLLPAFILAVQQAALIARMLRDGMLEIINEDYIRTAWAKGLRERTVLMKHAFLNAMIPTITVIGVSLANLMAGAVITEQIFVIPGLGNLLVGSIGRRDFPVVQGVILFVALVYIFVNLAIDLIYGLLDPRIRYD